MPRHYRGLGKHGEPSKQRAGARFGDVFRCCDGARISQGYVSLYSIGSPQTRCSLICTDATE